MRSAIITSYAFTLSLTMSVILDRCVNTYIWDIYIWEPNCFRGVLYYNLFKNKFNYLLRELRELNIQYFRQVLLINYIVKLFLFSVVDIEKMC